MAEEEPPNEPPKLHVLKGGARRRGFVTLDIYSSLADLYVVRGVRTLRGLSKESGISKDTCARAITHGWPERGWPPLRERAAAHDALQQKTNPKPIGEQLVIEAQKYKDMREDYRMMGRVLREVKKREITRTSEALEASTFYRHAMQFRVIDVQVGKKIVQRVVKENVRLPPYAPDVISSLSLLVSTLKQMSDMDIKLAKYIPDDGDEAPGWEALTDEQMDQIIATGKFPEGVTIEQLRKK